MAGHALVYRLLWSHAEFAATLTSTGHDYLGFANRLGSAAAVAALAAWLLGAILRPGARRPGLGAVAGRLAVFQLSAFTAMEIGERLHAGAGLHDLAHVLPAGLAVQTGLALVTAVLLRWLVAVPGVVAVGAAAGFRPPAPAWSIGVPAPRAPRAIQVGSRRSRSPPLVLG